VAKTWKVAIVGCGMIAEGIYIPEMKNIPNAQLVAVCDILPGRAKDYSERFNVPHWFDGIDELLAWGEFDILMDTASIQAHHEINMKALKAGKHLYSQKPVAQTVEQVTGQIEAAKAAGVKFSASPIHMIRPDIRIVKKLIEGGAIGRISMVRCHVAHGGPEYFQYRDVDPSWFYEPGAGALYDMGVHGITMVTGVMGPAKAVACMAAISEPERTIRSGAFNGKKIQSNKLYDNYLITLDWGNGTIGIIDTGFCQKASTLNHLEIYGSQGTITILGQLKIGQGDGVRMYLDSPERGVRGWIDPMPQEAPKGFYQCECLQDLIRAIETDTETGLRPEHARHVVDILTTIPKAIEEKRTLPLSTTF
jgi:predicted dehydrogenase